MHLLATFNARLNPCPVSKAAFTAHDQGRYCGQCRRVVLDFTQSANPAADLAAARASSPDGRVCGSFRRSQVQGPAPTLSRRLRCFLVALVLVVGQGLTAQEALAQVRKATTGKAVGVKHKAPAKQAAAQAAEPEEMLDGEVHSMPPEKTNVHTYVEQMPAAPGGGGTAGIIAYIQKRFIWPRIHLRTTVEGKIFVSFTVGTDGRAHDARIVKGLETAFDAEVLRVVQGITGFTPGRQNGQLVPVSLTVPITIKMK